MLIKNYHTYTPVSSSIIDYYNEQGILSTHQSTKIDSSTAYPNQGSYYITYNDGTVMREFYDIADNGLADSLD